jgi:hypothetical protein
MTYKMNIPSLQSGMLFLVLLLTATVCIKAETPAKSVKVDLYGHILVFDLPGDIAYRNEQCLNEENLTQSVEKFMKGAQTDSLIHQMENYALQLKMDDMAFLLMLNKVTGYVLKNESDICKTLFKYAVLQQKGFDVFIGYSENAVTLYGRTNIMIDNCLFIERGTKKYFDLSFNQRQQPHTEQLFVMRHQGKKTVPIVMNIISPPAFNAKHTKKVMPFEYDGFVYFFTARVNQSLVEYYKDLPTININTVYLNYGLSAGATGSLVKEIQKATAYMSTTESVNFILQFVQTTFEYKKDEQVYGQEKFSFPEETLMNPYSDCEDKAMLYAVLVNKVLGLKTVALYYKNAQHINIAIQNWNPASKGNFTFQNHDYIICEPSVKGYSIGESAGQINLASLIDW